MDNRYSLAQLPTPIHRWNVAGLPEGCELWIKRDDLSGMQLSGNKVRKLEFLLAEAKAQGCDCVITIGGIQSNHCRATAVAARYLGLEPYVILRTEKKVVDKDPGLVGNLLVERLIGAKIELMTRQEYVAIGSVALGENLKARLEAQGRKPYLIPVGGSNALGSWGYLQAVAEIEAQLEAGIGPSSVDDIVLASGSGGTAAGMALGVHLSSLTAQLHSYGVCDSPQYFHDHITGLLRDMGYGDPVAGVIGKCLQAKGAAYGVSQPAELKVMQEVAHQTGVIMDPVYSGKALYRLLEDMKADPKAWEHRRVLFIHTGGMLGMYDKVDQLQPLVEGLGNVSRFPVGEILGSDEDDEERSCERIKGCTIS
mmetsp:Transcript_11515/g.19655  ORF Transcript_11515/g.19655 Transcript_11515/m.19655 type:complete len:367 (+) Transcript_11515:775-1875(+)